jgi:hypothetical protein
MGSDLSAKRGARITPYAKGIDMNTRIPLRDIHRLLHAEHDDPFGVLGMHQIDQVWVVRCLRQDAKELAIVERHNVERASPRPASQRKVYLKPNWRAYQRPLTIS